MSESSGKEGKGRETTGEVLILFDGRFIHGVRSPAHPLTRSCRTPARQHASTPTVRQYVGTPVRPSVRPSFSHLIVRKRCQQSSEGRSHPVDPVQRPHARRNSGAD